MKVCAFIFARGGSKGLPGKNIKKIGGIPLVAHSIRVAQQLPDTPVFVSTDCDQIADVATEWGAQVIRRPEHLATDAAPEWEAWRHAISAVRELGFDFDTFLSLPATSPLRNVQDVMQCLTRLTKDTDAVVTVTHASRSPFFNMVSRDDSGVTQILVPDANYTRRQDAPVAYDMTTVAYVLRPEFILSKPSLFSGHVKSVVIPKERAVDIDDVWDFKIAECFFTQDES